MSLPRLRALVLLCVMGGGTPGMAQSYQSRFEQVKFDREGAGGSKAGVTTVDGATGAVSVDMPLGPGIGGNGLRFTPAVRLRSTALHWTQTNVTDPNAYMGTPPFLWFSPAWAGISDATALTAQSTTQTVDFTTGGRGTLSPGTLDLALPESRSHVLSTVTYPDGGSSTLGAGTSPGSVSYPNGFVPAGTLPSGALDPSTALNAFGHGPASGWSVAKLPYFLNSGVSNPASPSAFVTTASGGELVVGLTSPAAPMMGVPEPDMTTHVMQIPSCVLVIRGDVAYEYAYVGTIGGSLYRPLPRTVSNPDGRTYQWLASAHYVLTRMLNRFGDAIQFDHGVNLLGLGTSGVTTNGFDYTATWMRNGTATGVSVSLSLGAATTVPAQPIEGSAQTSTAGTQAQVSYAGVSPAPAYGFVVFTPDGGTGPTQPSASLAFYQANGMDGAWDSASGNLLPISVTDQTTQGTISFTYNWPGTGIAPVLTQVTYPNGRRQSFTWGSYPYRPNVNSAIWGTYSADTNRRNAQAYGVTQVTDADTVLNGYAFRTTTHTRTVPQPDLSNDTGWLSTSFYDAVAHPDGSVTVYFYVEPVPGGAAGWQTLGNLQQQAREVREYPDGSTWQNDVTVAASASTAARITVYDHWDLRSVANPSGDLSILGGHPYPTRTRIWNKETGILQLEERTTWDATNFAWGASTRQSYLAATTPSLTVDYPSLAAGGSVASYANLQRKVDGAATSTFDAARWIGPLATFSQGTTTSDATSSFTSAGGAAPAAQPPTTTAFLTGTSLPQTVTAGNSGLQVRTAFTYPGGATPTSPTPADATLSDPAGTMLNSGLVGAIYSYDSYGRLNAIQPKGAGWQAHQSQDALGRVISQTGADGVVTSYAWDAAGRLTSTQVGSETATTYAYNDTDHRTVTVTRGSQVSELHHDAFGELILEKRTAQGVASYKVYGRDSMGRVNGETLWLPATVNGHTVTDTDAFQPNLLVTTTTTTPAYDRCTKWDMTGDGSCIAWRTIPATTTTYPAMYMGTQTFFDGLGRVIEVKGPNGEDLLTSYGSWSGGAQVIRTEVGAQVWNPATGTSTATNRATTLQYDAEGRLAKVTDPAQQTTSYFYDVAGRLAQVSQSGGGVTQTRTWAYDALGRVTSMTQPESGTTSYSAFTVTGKPTVTAYGAGSAARVVSASIDPLDRVTGLSSSDGSVTQSFTYADAGGGLATGKLTSATSNGITRTLAYGGPAGELSTLTRTVDGNSFVLQLGYDAATGNLTSRTYPDGKIQTISYDLERGLPSGSTFNGATLASFGYDGASWLLTGLTYGNNGTSVFGYTNERLATMAHAIPGKTLASWAFAYDQASQLKTDGEDAYGYDALGRLVQAEVRDPQDAASGHGLQQVISYDAFGNRTGLATQKVTNWTDPTNLPASPSLTSLSSDPRALRTYAMTSGEITAMGATNRLPSTVGGVSTGVAYDAQGNLTQIWGTPGSSATQLTMTYDSLGRVTTLGDTAHTTSQTYGFDDEGLRIKTVDSATGVTSYNIYDEGRRLVAQYVIPSGGSLTWKKDLVYVGAKEVAEVDSTHTWVEFLDHLGSPRYEWDGSAPAQVNGIPQIDGVHLIAQKYAPFGEYLNDPVIQAKFGKGFTNHEQTDNSGLVYAQARFYAPWYGRFLSPDPARDQHFEQTQSWNIYSYVQNDPTMNVDPNGMQEAPAKIVNGLYYYRVAGGGYRVTTASGQQVAAHVSGPPPKRPVIIASGRMDEDSSSILGAMAAVSGLKTAARLGGAIVESLTGKEGASAAAKGAETLLKDAPAVDFKPPVSAAGGGAGDAFAAETKALQEGVGNPGIPGAGKPGVAPDPSKLADVSTDRLTTFREGTQGALDRRLANPNPTANDLVQIQSGRERIKLIDEELARRNK